MNIKNFINENGILKATKMIKKDKELQETLWLHNYPYDKVSEILYCAYHNISPPICSYGNKRKFLDFSSGYNLSCNLAKKKECNCYLDRRKKLTKEILHNPDNKEKFSEKRKKTNIKKYGVDNIFKDKDIQQKYKNTMISKYGVDNPQKIKDIKEKTQQTNFNKYGHTNPLASIPIKKSMLENNITLHGCKNTKQRHINPIFYDVIQSKELFSNFVSGKTYKELLDEFNVGSTLLSKWIDLYNIKNSIKYSTYRSKEEIEVFNYLNTFGNIIVESNKRNIIQPKEIDLFLPDFNIAIEYNGLYWHGEKYGRNKNYHKNKLLECNKKEIELIQIFSDEWKYKQSIVKSILSTKLGLNQKIYARKTQIKEVSERESKMFLDANHLQGNVIGSNKRYGLFYNDELISIMTFQFKKEKWELKRYANKLNTNIIGGASKLFKFFIKENNPQEIFSYCDLRYFNGGIYKSLGFIYDKTTIPGYFYTDGIRRYHRLNFTKKKLIQEGHDPSKTEKEIMTELGYDIIWDCGHSKWIWRNN